MKVWNSFGSEHSANLVIIGTFATMPDASDARATLDDLTRVALDQFEKHQGQHLAKPMLDAVLQHSVDLTVEDSDSLGYDYDATVEGERLVIRTEETAVQAFIKILLRHGAKIEVYSAHDHPGRYGRHSRPE